MESHSGSYVLLFFCPHALNVLAGRLGELSLQRGYYLYCGSAFGPGGLRARTDHHRRISKRPHWHLDYLRPHLELLEVWYSFDPERREHQWAAQLGALHGAWLPFPGFGASDCSCQSHLVRLGYKPSFAGFRKRIRNAIPRHRPIYRELVGGVKGGAGEPAP